MFVTKFLLCFVLISVCWSSKSHALDSGTFPIKAEFLDCFTDDEVSQQTSTESPPDEINCTDINSELANCTCTKDYIDCSDRSFYSIPMDLTKMPSTVVRLFFSKNQINSLDKLELNPEAKISAIDLKQNKIKHIDAEGFFTPQLANSLDYLSMCGNLNLNDFNGIKTNFTKLSWLELNHVIEPLEIKDGFINKERFPSLLSLNLNHANLKIAKHSFDR